MRAKSQHRNSAGSMASGDTESGPRREESGLSNATKGTSKMETNK